MKISTTTQGPIRRFGVERGIELIREAGFSAVDWTIGAALVQSAFENGDYENADCVFLRSDGEIDAYFAPQLEAIRKNGLTVGQAHAPFPSYAYGGRNPRSLETTIPLLKNCIRFCQRTGVPYLVIHGVLTGAVPPEEVDRLNDKLYSALIPTLLEGDTVACMEDVFLLTRREGKPVILPGHCCIAEEAVAFIDEMNRRAGREAFGLCLDSGHLNLLDADVPAYIRALGSRIKCLHLHDNDGLDDLHRAPYTGTVAWKGLCEALREIGYAGTINFEADGQISERRIEQEMVLPWLKYDRAAGEHFRDLIRG